MKKYLFLTLFLAAFIPCIYSLKLFFLKNEEKITQIYQLPLQKEALSCLYLAELLDLSFDKKINKEDFDLEKGLQKLLASPLIDHADLCFLKGGVLQVQYKHVTPFALLSDFNNAAIDSFGKIFPIKPFFSPKGLTKIFLGIENVQNSFTISDYKEKTKWDFAKNMLKQIYDLQIKGDILLLDVSKVEEKSLGKNEVVLTLKYKERKDILRLTKRNYLNELKHYIILSDKLSCDLKICVIDLRHGDQALIEKL
jgi:hypothetical protein